ncbi:MAG TPA: hypothetical protein DCS93_36875 [Microscillaceae bacterium]|nr:hypothetical protein [Microscillaceae bacterium]
MYTGTFHNYQILINPKISQRSPANFTTYLYNSDAHLAQQPCNEQVSFYLVNTKKRITEAAFHIFIEDEAAISPCRAPFGGIEFNPQLHLEALQFFWENIEAFLQTQHLKSLKIKAYPVCYQPENAQVLHYLLLHNGFQIDAQDLNYHLAIDEHPFQSKLHHSEKRRLQKCHQHGYSFERWTTPDFAWVHRFIQQNRERKGYPTSLSAEALQQLFQKFPDHCTLFVLKDEERIIALATGIRVNAKVLYYFLPADDEAYLADSPMVQLIKGLYQYCQQEGYQLLDLGISTALSQPNYGLINFKKNLGAETSMKWTFSKEF